MTSLTPEVMQVLYRPFPDSDIKQSRPTWDGTRLSYISWDKIASRLDEAFGGAWDFEIIRYEIQAGQCIVHGRLKACGVTKDNLGTWPLTMAGGTPADCGMDFKSAASEALKRCAVLFGVGIQLYQKDGPPAVTPQPVQEAQQQQVQHLLATPTQVQAVRTLFHRFQYMENQACKALAVTSLDHITGLIASQLLAGQHPLITWLSQQRPTGGSVAVSNA